MKLVRFRSFFAFVCNALTFVFVTICVLGFFVSNGQGNMQVTGFEAFKFFTVDSNVIAAIACLLMMPFNLRSLAKGKLRIPKWAIIAKYIGVCSITVTLLTVIFMLGPNAGFDNMFAGNNFYMHMVCPILCISSFLICECGSAKIGLVQGMIGIIPVLIYGGIYYYNVMISQVWTDFYGFTLNGNWQINAAIIIVGSMVVCMLITVLYNTIAKLFK